MRRVSLGIVLVVSAVAWAGSESSSSVMWHDPGPVAKLDFGGSLGAPVQAPRAPYHFVREDLSGTQVKVVVKDANGTDWNVKFGNEVKPESFSWRLARAAGYYAEPNFYVPSGQIEGMPALQRSAPSWLQPDGKFTSARFQWRDPAYQFVNERNWSWNVNPFRRTKELNGLKIVLMLTSNFDNKDGSDHFGPNTGVFVHTVNGRPEYVYTFTDWGSSMGYWGHGTGQTDWRCEHFTEQTKDFVRGVAKGQVLFGYAGLHTDDFKTGIRPADVAWLMQYLGQVTDEQLRAGLRSSGATPAEETCFTAAIRSRLDALKNVGGTGAKPAPPR